MALESFYETMVIDTPEAAANLAKAIEDREKNGPLVLGPVQGVDNDPEFIRELRDALQARQRLQHRRPRAIVPSPEHILNPRPIAGA